MPELKIETGTEDFLARVEGRVAILTMNRPERRNALSGAMLDGMAKAFDECERNTDIGCVILTGSGRGFCAGGDIKGMGQSKGSGPKTPDEAVHLQRLSEKATVGRIYRMPKPVLAALPGAAAGAGMGLCMACDLRMASENAVMTTAFTKVGFSGDYGLPYLLSQQVGRAKALELFYLSDKLDMKRCLELGLVNWVVPEDELEKRALEVATQLASGPSVAYRYVKENINAAFEQNLDEHIDNEVMRHIRAGGTEDHREAVQAFMEKRTPVFKGR